VLTNTRLRYIWCVLAGGILLYSLLPGSSRIYHLIATFGSNRWVHFLAYSAAAAIPVSVCRRRMRVLFSLAIGLLATVLELLQEFIPGFAGQPIMLLRTCLEPALGCSVA